MKLIRRDFNNEDDLKNYLSNISNVDFNDFLSMEEFLLEDELFCITYRVGNSIIYTIEGETFLNDTENIDIKIHEEKGEFVSFKSIEIDVTF